MRISCLDAREFLAHFSQRPAQFSTCCSSSSSSHSSSASDLTAIPVITALVSLNIARPCAWEERQWLPIPGRNSLKLIPSLCLVHFLYKFSKMSSPAAFYSEYTEALTSRNFAGGWLESALRSCAQVMLSKGDWSVAPGDGEGDFCETLDTLVQHIVKHCATLCHVSNHMMPSPVPQVCVS